MTQVRTFLGHPYPLGATWMGNGVNFAIFSEHASRVELCLFDSMEDAKEYVRIPINECTDQVWHVFLPDVAAGTVVRFSRIRPVRARERPAFQQLEAPPRSVRESDRGSSELGG